MWIQRVSRSNSYLQILYALRLAAARKDKLLVHLVKVGHQHVSEPEHLVLKSINVGKENVHWKIV